MLIFTYQTAWRASYTGDFREESWLKRQFTWMDMTDTRHKARCGFFPTLCSLDFTNKVMSHGQVIHAVRQAKADGIQIGINDTTKRYLVETGPIPPDYLPDITGYDYQLLTAQIALGAGHGIVNMATSSGKTVVMGMVVKALAATDCPGILILIFSKDLLNQTARRLESYGIPLDDIGIIHSDVSPEKQREAATKRIVLSTHLSIVKYNGVIERTRYVICDECFPAGTLVGCKKIENLKVGDIVPSFNEASGTITTDKVVRIMHRKPHSLITFKTTAGKVSCTDEHPFLTPIGWVVASNLQAGMFVAHENYLRHLRSRDREATSVVGAGSQLRPMQSREVGKNKNLLCDPISLSGVPVSSSCGYRHQKTTPPSQGRNSVQSRVCQGSQDQNLRSPALRVQQDPLFSKDERTQPDALRENPTQNVGNPQVYRTQTKNERRERSSAANSSTDSIRRSGLGLDNGISNQHEEYSESKRTQTTNLLQVRHGKSNPDVSRRGGRRQPLRSKDSRKGPQKNQGFNWVRVESIEVHESGSDGTFGGRCPDGYVYNIETKQHHTYLANGFVVHNCHRSASPLWSALFGILPNLTNALGFTATPWDNENERQKMLAIYGQELVRIPLKFLIDRGIVMNPEAYFIRLHYKDRDIKLTEAMDWREAQKQFIYEDRNRNLLPIVALRKFGGRMLVLYDSLKHGEHLRELYEEQGFETRLAEGKTKTSSRESAISWFEQDCKPGQHGKVLLASEVFDEGIDIKGGCDLFFPIGAGKDASKVTQRAGRALRKNRSGLVRFFDVQDSNHEILSRWSGIRRKTWETCGIKVRQISLDDFAAL